MRNISAVFNSPCSPMKLYMQPFGLLVAFIYLYLFKYKTKESNREMHMSTKTEKSKGKGQILRIRFNCDRFNPAERLNDLRLPINLRLMKQRVPALVGSLWAIQNSKHKCKTLEFGWSDKTMYTLIVFNWFVAVLLFKNIHFLSLEKLLFNVYKLSQHCSTIQSAFLWRTFHLGWNRYGGIPSEAKTRLSPVYSSPLPQLELCYLDFSIQKNKPVTLNLNFERLNLLFLQCYLTRNHSMSLNWASPKPILVYVFIYVDPLSFLVGVFGFVTLEHRTVVITSWCMLRFNHPLNFSNEAVDYFMKPILFCAIPLQYKKSFCTKSMFQQHNFQ